MTDAELIERTIPCLQAGIPVAQHAGRFGEVNMLRATISAWQERLDKLKKQQRMPDFGKQGEQA